MVDLKGCFPGLIPPADMETASFNRISSDEFSLKVSNFSSCCEITLNTRQVKALIKRMVNKL